MTTNRPLRVFLCHSSNDKPAVRELYQKLRSEPWIQPWLDEEELYPGQDWNLEIQKAIREIDAIIVCLSKGSITKEGYVQKEIKTALDFADEKPEGTTYIIPIRLDECDPPSRLSKWQYADYFEGNRERALQRLLISLKSRANTLGLKVDTPTTKQVEKPVEKNMPILEKSKNVLFAAQPNKLILTSGMEFMRIPAGKFVMGSNDGYHDDEKPQHILDIPYDYWMARFPVTNEQYNFYAISQGIKHSVSDWEKKKDHPVVFVDLIDAITYCDFFSRLCTSEIPSGLVMRLPTESEWEKAARGASGYMYPWGNYFDKNKCNMEESGNGNTTSVYQYSPQGDSPYHCADMSGNVIEWTHTLSGTTYPYKANDGREDETIFADHVVRGGSFDAPINVVTCVWRGKAMLDFKLKYLGFRVCLAPSLSK